MENTDQKIEEIYVERIALLKSFGVLMDRLHKELQNIEDFAFSNRDVRMISNVHALKGLVQDLENAFGVTNRVPFYILHPGKA